jgi:nitrogen-specific signal transduction histidine kinase
MSERLKRAWGQFRGSVRAIHQANGVDIKPGAEMRYMPTGDAAVFDEVDATPEELLLYLDSRNARSRSQIGVLQKYALSGLATEMTMHEANGLLSRLRSYATHFVEVRPDDSYAHHLKDAAVRLQDDFDFLARFRVSGGSSYYSQSSETLLKTVRHEFWRALGHGDLVIEASEAFMAINIEYDRRVIDAVMINLVRNSYYWGSDAGRKPVVVRFDVEQMEYERDTWDEETDTYGTEMALTNILVIEDNGPGVPPGLGDDIFEPGVSGRRSSGIGLHICRTGLESSGHTIVAEEERSELGGARFRIGRKVCLRPDAVSYDQIEKPREIELADALVSMCDLVRNGDIVEAERLSDVYEEAAGLAMRLRLRGPQNNIEERLLLAVDDFHSALSDARDFDASGSITIGQP